MKTLFQLSSYFSHILQMPHSFSQTKVSIHYSASFAAFKVIALVISINYTHSYFFKYRTKQKSERKDFIILLYYY